MIKFQVFNLILKICQNCIYFNKASSTSLMKIYALKSNFENFNLLQTCRWSLNCSILDQHFLEFKNKIGLFPKSQ